jgi:hypothetical protein
MLAEPSGLTAAQRKFRRAVINAGLSYPAFGEAIGYTGNRKTIAQRVYLKVRGLRDVTKIDLLLVEHYGQSIGRDLFEAPDAATRNARVKRGKDGRKWH